MTTVGELNAMCSSEEVALRMETRQIDKFEMGDERKFVKKYQRSSADKKYLPSEIRSVSACVASVEYLLSTILDFDICPKPGFADPCYSADYFDIYSFLRDRLRAVRVDLHVQNCVTNPEFVRIHEICLRFELLSLYLLWGRDFGGQDRKFDLHMSLTALSQTIDPLTNAWAQTADGGRAKLSACILLLSLTSSSSKQFKSQYLKFPKPVQESPEVVKAFEICENFFALNWAQVLHAFSKLDFLTSCALLPVLDRARLGLLRTLVRTNRPFFVRPGDANLPQPRPECIGDLSETLVSENAAEFASFNGLQTVGNKVFLPPRQLTRNPFRWWFSTAEWREKTGSVNAAEFVWNNQEAFETQLGSVGEAPLPPRSLESFLASKFSNNRKAIVLGAKVLQVQPTFAAAGAADFVPSNILVQKDEVAPPIPFSFPKPRPARPVVPLQPLQAPAPLPTTPLQVVKRDLDSPPGSVPPKRQSTLAVVAPKSDFDLLAEQLDLMSFCTTEPAADQLIVQLQADRDAHTHEVRIGLLRTRFVALKCLRNWQAVCLDRAKWRVKPFRLE